MRAARGPVAERAADSECAFLVGWRTLGDKQWEGRTPNRPALPSFPSQRNLLAKPSSQPQGTRPIASNPARSKTLLAPGWLLPKMSRWCILRVWPASWSDSEGACTILSLLTWATALANANLPAPSVTISQLPQPQIHPPRLQRDGTNQARPERPALRLHSAVSPIPSLCVASRFYNKGRSFPPRRPNLPSSSYSLSFPSSRLSPSPSSSLLLSFPRGHGTRLVQQTLGQLEVSPGHHRHPHPPCPPRTPSLPLMATRRGSPRPPSTRESAPATTSTTRTTTRIS